MCFRPADPIKKVACEKCGTMVIPGIKCKNCGHVMPRQENQGIQA